MVDNLGVGRFLLFNGFPYLWVASKFKNQVRVLL